MLSFCFSLWLALASALISPAYAADLPGISLSFDVTPGGAWVLPASLPPAFASAGVKPGWRLTAVDGLKLGEQPKNAEVIVAKGPARAVRLHFETPAGEVIVEVPRAPLVVVEEVGLLPWPEGMPAGVGRRWAVSPGGVPHRVDSAGNAWALDVVSGAQAAAPAVPAENLVIPELWWSLAEVPWVVLDHNGVRSGDRAWARGALGNAARLTSFQARTGDHLALPSETGLTLYSVAWPQGTPDLPVCLPAVPETCLVSGRSIVRSLLSRPGGKAEALRVLGEACEGGTYRACLEAVAIEDPSLAPRVESCAAEDVNSCHELARARVSLLAEGTRPSPLLVGVLEYSCAVDASGSLGQRLRRLEEVGEGCMLLSKAFDRLDLSDRALLSLDQACLLGRAEACDDATVRRKDAYTRKIVRECDDSKLPLANSCVRLGVVLEEGPSKVTPRDAFTAFSRACELGDEEGCIRLGDYVDRWGISHPRVVDAERRLLESCEAGEQRACVGTAHLLVRHEPRSEAYGEALTRFATACEAGIPTACIAGAEQRRVGVARRAEVPEPVDMWSSACELGSAPGCAGLGDKLRRSKSTWEAAYDAWNKACDTGEAGACTDLGRFVEQKHEPAWPGEQPATSYLERGCENGDAAGCYWLAERDLPKKGDPPEPAYVLLDRSCADDHGLACAALAQVHLERDTNFDDEIAADHLQNACDNGHFESCRELSTMYLRGRGVEKDNEIARDLAQRYSANAPRRHGRLGISLGFPSGAGAEAEAVLPIPVGPSIALTGAYSFLPEVGGALSLLRGEDWPANPAPYQYIGLGARVYVSNKARGIYGMADVCQIDGGSVEVPLTRSGFSGRVGLYSESRAWYTRIEMGLGRFGSIDISDWDEDEQGVFPLIEAAIALSAGVSFF